MPAETPLAASAPELTQMVLRLSLRVPVPGRHQQIIASPAASMTDRIARYGLQWSVRAAADRLIVKVGGVVRLAMFHLELSTPSGRASGSRWTALWCCQSRHVVRLFRRSFQPFIGPPGISIRFHCRPRTANAR